MFLFRNLQEKYVNRSYTHFKYLRPHKFTNLHNVLVVSLTSRSHSLHSILVRIADRKLTGSIVILNVSSLQWHDAHTKFSENLLMIQNALVEQKGTHTLP
jgi:hypothetical protein